MFLPRSPLSQTSPGNKTVKLVSEVVFSVSLLHFTLSPSNEEIMHLGPDCLLFLKKTKKKLYNMFTTKDLNQYHIPRLCV